MLIGVSIAASALTSIIVTRIIAAQYFKIVDGYVKDMCDLTDSANKRTLETIDKLENIPALKMDEEALYRAVQKGQRKLEARYSVDRGGKDEK